MKTIPWLERWYLRWRDRMSPVEERGERSAGYLQNEIRTQTVKVCSNRTGRLLEVGCGEGLLLARLRNANAALEIWGVDNQTEPLQKARQRLSPLGIPETHVIESQGQTLPFEDGFFDTVVFVNVMGNICDQRDVVSIMAEIRRVLKTGGGVVVEFRNRNNFLLGLKYKLAPLYDSTLVDHPLSTYTESWVRRLLLANQLTVTRERGIGFPWRLFAPVVILEAVKHG